MPVLHWQPTATMSLGKRRSSTATIRNPFRYTGQQLDSETALYYFRARYYAPELGIFISKDPVYSPRSPYVYAENNPTKYVDPDGKSAVLAVVIFGLLFVAGVVFVHDYGQPVIEKQAELIETNKRFRDTCGVDPTSDDCAKLPEESVQKLSELGEAEIEAGLNFPSGTPQNPPMTDWIDVVLESFKIIPSALSRLKDQGFGNKEDNTESSGSVLGASTAYALGLDEHHRWRNGSPYQLVAESSRKSVDVQTYSNPFLQFPHVLTGPSMNIGRSPNRPTPSKNGGAYDWAVTYNGNPPTICAEEHGDPDGHAIVGYQFAVDGAQSHTSGVVGSCYTPPNLGYFTFAWRGSRAGCQQPMERME